MFPPEILADIQRGKQLSSELNQQYLNDLEFGSCLCDIKLLYKLNDILKSLEYKVEKDNLDTIAIDLYYELMEIIGGEIFNPIPPIVGKIYYGSVDYFTPISQSTIETFLNIDYREGDEIIIPFNISNYRVPFIAMTNIVPAPNYYKNLESPFDEGEVGNSTGLLNAPYISGNYRVMQGNYWATLTDNVYFYNV